MGFGFLFKVTLTGVALPSDQQNPTFVAAQVDEHSVFRHRGERKVKTVEEDTEEVASKMAELLNEEEELTGNWHKRLVT